MRTTQLMATTYQGTVWIALLIIEGWTIRLAFMAYRCGCGSYHLFTGF